MKLAPQTLQRVLDLPPTPSPLPPATGISFHSARVRPGDAFFAFGGQATHGIRFADDALANGAAFVVSDREHPQGVLVPDAAAALLALGRHARAQWTAPVVGVTGSAGKTSTKQFLAAALNAGSSPGNFNTPYALATTLVNAWLDGRATEPLVLEMGIDHPGEMAVLTDLVRPDAGILTLVGAAHLEALGSLAGVAREKSVLLRASTLRVASAQAYGWLADDLAEDTVQYALAPAEADVVGEVLDRTGATTRIRIDGHVASVPSLSQATAENAVGAWTVATRLGVDPDVAAKRLADVELPSGRLQARAWPGGTLLDDTYNSNPASAAIALEALRSCPPPHTAVLGDMLELGERAAELHRELGAATRGLDRVFAFGPESAAIATGNPDAEHFGAYEDLAAALRELPREGTVLVKASRGMRLERAVDLLLAEEPS